MEPATFLFVALCLNQYATACPTHYTVAAAIVTGLTVGILFLTQLQQISLSEKSLILKSDDFHEGITTPEV
jgi:hypothetical protein